MAEELERLTPLSDDDKNTLVIEDQLEAMSESPELQETGPESMEDGGMARWIFRNVYSGLTGGAGERAMQGAGVPPMDPSLTGGILEGVGMVPGAFAGGAALAPFRGISALQKFRRATQVAETGLVGGAQEAALAGAKGEDRGDAAMLGGVIGMLPEGALRAVGYGLESLKGANHTVLSRVLEKMGLEKGLDTERKELVEVLRKYEAPIVGAERPKDWYIDLAEQRVSRSAAGRPWMQRAAERLDNAMVQFSDDTITAIGPGNWTGYQYYNSDLGSALQKAFKVHVKELHDTASGLYNSIFDKSSLGDRAVPVQGMIHRLEDVLDKFGFDPSAAMQDPTATRVHAFLSALKEKAKKIELYGPDGEVISTQDEFVDRPLRWLHSRLGVLNKSPTKGPPSQDQAISRAAAHEIREEVHDLVGGISPEHGAAMDEARVLWRTYFEWLEHPIAKPLSEVDPSKTIDALFKTPAVIAETRKFLPQESFDLARQRWVANMLFGGVKPTDVGKIKIDATLLNSRIKSMGGYNEETVKAAFSDAPDKLAALRKLQLVLTQLRSPTRRYRGQADVPGGPETKGIAALLKSIFTTVTFPAHLLMTSSMGKHLTSPHAINPYLGGIPLPGPLDKDIYRSIASVGARTPSR